METDFYQQWECRIDLASLEPDTMLAAVVEVARQEMVEGLASDGGMLSLASVVGHRLENGDAIDVHNDANDFGELVRLVWMLGQSPDEGGGFAICSAHGSILLDVPFAPDRWVLLAVVSQRTNLAARPRFDVGPGESCSGPLAR